MPLSAAFIHASLQRGVRQNRTRSASNRFNGVNILDSSSIQALSNSPLPLGEGWVRAWAAEATLLYSIARDEFAQWSELISRNHKKYSVGVFKPSSPALLPVGEGRNILDYSSMSLRIICCSTHLAEARCE